MTALTRVASSDNGGSPTNTSRLECMVSGGTQYHIAVDGWYVDYYSGWGVQTGNIVLNWYLTDSDGDGPFRESGGLVAMEAEHCHRQLAGTGEAADHAWLETTTLASTSGEGAMLAGPNTDANCRDTVDGPCLEYDVDFQTTGVYYVWIRLLGASDKDDSVHAGLDGVPATLGRLGMYDNSGNWHWEQNVHKRPGEVRATVVVDTPGLHTVNLWMREDGVAVDKIVLTTDATYVPSGTGPDGLPLNAPPH